MIENTLKIFNTLTKKKEVFNHSVNKNINLYVCGVTPYSLCHIGHARTFITFDIITRYFQHIGYKTFYVRNITDIDDKIINTAHQQNKTISELVFNMIRFMGEDFSNLNLNPPNKEPRVTECMSEIISMISHLLVNKFAYIANNRDILFSIDSYKNYGLLSRRFFDYSSFLKDRSHYKLHRNQLDDFVLWKYQGLSEYTPYPSWQSPWGLGRPGWHIECSAIINKSFKNTVNFHGGGVDLLFPHHENELAQLNCCKNSCKIDTWIHVGMLILNNQKMSKSLLNTITIRNLLKKYDSEVIRYYFLSTRYRHPLYYSEKNLNMFQDILRKIYSSIIHCVINVHCKTDYASDLRDKFKSKFYQAMNDDFNTPQACLILQQLSQYINKIKKNNNYLANILASDLVYLGNILGLLNHLPIDFLNQCSKLSKSDIIIIENLVRMRNKLRLKKQWNLADILRKKLMDLGVVIEDSASVSHYRFLK